MATTENDAATAPRPSKPSPRNGALTASLTSAASQPPNALEFELPPKKKEPPSPEASESRRSKRRPRASQAEAAPSEKPADAKSPAATVPDTVRERFIQIGTQFYFPDGGEAFTDHGSRVTTRSENAVVIQSMVAIAQSRGASSLKVSGTDFFKKEAWFAGKLAGLDVSGYIPSALEQQRLVRALARRRTAENPDEVAAPVVQPEPKSPRRGARPAKADSAKEEDELIVGRLVDHGPAPYQHQAGRTPSYYVRIETERGDREIWGVDLERAFRQSLSTPGVGDEVGLRSIGKDAVRVLAPERDSNGREVGLKEIDTHRNRWLVEKQEFLDKRHQMAEVFRNLDVNAANAVQRFPELEGSYLQLQVARVGVEQRIESREAREQFVDHLRAHLAKAIEYGQPLEPVRLKAKGEPVVGRVQDREYAPSH
jgi:hypothetical protein